MQTNSGYGSSLAPRCVVDDRRAADPDEYCFLSLAGRCPPLLPFKPGILTCYVPAGPSLFRWHAFSGPRGCVHEIPGACSRPFSPRGVGNQRTPAAHPMAYLVAHPVEQTRFAHVAVALGAWTPISG